MDVDRLGRVHARRRLRELGDVKPELGVQLLERPQNGKVEDRAQIDVEAFGALTREHDSPAREAVNRGVGEGHVVGRRQRPDVARRARHVLRERGDLGAEPESEPVRVAVSVAVPAAEPVAADVPVDARDVVELAPVPRGRVERGDRADVVQERAAYLQHRGEGELERDVGAAVAVVVDVDLVQDVVAELVEVRSGRRPLERKVVRDQRHRVRVIWTYERV